MDDKIKHVFYIFQLLLDFISLSITLNILFGFCLIITSGVKVLNRLRNIRRLLNNIVYKIIKRKVNKKGLYINNYIISKMSDECKLFVRNIPDAFPEDKFNEILKKQFENSVSNVNMYKHVHKFKNKLNKVCYFSVKSEETRQKVFDFFANFELIDQRGLKHKLKVITSLFPLNNTTDIEDKLNNTYNQRIL